MYIIMIYLMLAIVFGIQMNNNLDDALYIVDDEELTTYLSNKTIRTIVVSLVSLLWIFVAIYTLLQRKGYVK